MLLTITTTHRPATDLGYLLHKHPARVQTFELAFGAAHVFYPEATAERCTAALLLDIDPVSLVRRHRRVGGGLLAQYVNDRPYVASSFLSVAIAQVFGTALGGRSAHRPELVGRELPLTATVAALPCRRGEEMVQRLFEPLGYRVALEHPEAARAEGDPEGGPYRNLRLVGAKRVAELLTHLYVLIPVLDEEKHYWVGSDEVDKLLRRGAGWLAGHPQRELIAQRYLRRQRTLAREALLRLSEGDEEGNGVDQPAAVQGTPAADGASTSPAAARVEGSGPAGGPSAPRAAATEELRERSARLHELRIEAVAQILERSGAVRVLDLGCGEGRLLLRLLRNRQFREITGVDVSARALEIAAQRLERGSLADTARQRVTLLHGALTYRDKRLAGYDAAAVVEVIEHLDAARLAAFERVLFAAARPATVVITTPNREYNANFPTLAPGALRHPDHCFEWTRAQFAHWAERVAAAHGYRVAIESIGPVDPERGAPTQMGILAVAP